MPSAPCGQPSGQHSMETSTVASAASSRAGRQLGLCGPSRSVISQRPQASLGSEAHQTPPLMLPGCIARGLAQLRSATDANRSRPTQDRHSQHSCSWSSPRYGSACMQHCAAMTQTSPPSQRQTLPAQDGHTHGRQPTQPPWIDRHEWQSGVCCTASSSLEPSTGTSTEAHRSHTVVRMQPARHSWPPSATSCSAAPSPRQSGSGLQPHGLQCPSSQLLHCTQTFCWQMTGVDLGSQQQTWRACGRSCAFWSSLSSGIPTAMPGHSQTSPCCRRTSRRESSQQPGSRCGATGCWLAQTSDSGQECSATGSGDGSPV